MDQTRGCVVKGCSLLFSLGLCLIGIGVILWFIALSGSSPGGIFSTVQNYARLGNRQVQGPVIPLGPGGDGRPADLLLENWRLDAPLWEMPGQAARRVIPIYLSLTSDTNGRQVLWELEVGTDEDSRAHQLTFDSAQVYISTGMQLQALDRESGHLLWQATLSDLVETGCRDCMRVVNERLIVLTTDQVLHGFDISSGALIWQVALNDGQALSSSAGQAGFSVAGGKILVIDAVESDRNIKEARLYNPLDGTETGRMQPVCSDPGGFFPDANLSPSDPILVGLEGNRLTFIIETISFESCVQNWDVANGRLLWETRLPEGSDLALEVPPGLLNSLTGPFFVEGANALYLSLEIGPGGQSAIYRLDQESGRLDRLAAVDDYSLTPLAEQGEVLVVRAVRTRGSEPTELWGLNSSSGIQLWQHQLLAEKLQDVDIGIGNEWVYRLTPHGLIVIQLLDDPLQLVVQRLDTSTGQLLVDATADAGDRFWSGVAWTNNAAYLTLRRLYDVDLLTGDVRLSWP